LFPDELFPKSKPVIGHFYITRFKSPQVKPAEPCNGEGVEVERFAFSQFSPFKQPHPPAELYPPDLTGHPGFEGDRTAHPEFRVRNDFLYMPGIRVGGENEQVCFLLVNIEAGSTPGTVISGNCQCKNMVFMNKIEDSLIDRVHGV
jgi:hypothetical protein